MFSTRYGYGKSKDLAKITQSDKVLRDKAFNKKSTSLNIFSGSGIVNEPNYQLANELHKPIIRKLKKEKFIHFLETIFGLLILLICNP